MSEERLLAAGNVKYVPGPLKAAIMQPHYLPWAGYFRLAAAADVFVLLDDVQSVRPSWQNRNRILSGGKPAWLTVPLVHTQEFRLIRETGISDEHPWRARHAKAVANAYDRHPFFEDAVAAIEPTSDLSLTRLADLNERLFRHIASALGIATRLVRSSELAAPGERTGRLIAICEALGATHYISPPGSAEYLAQDAFTARSSIELSFNEFDPPVYPQAGSREFVSHLSIVDAIANLGFSGAGRYVTG